MTLPPPPGNVTSDFPTLFRNVSATLGFDPTILFLAGFIFTIIPLVYFKAPRFAYPIFFFIYTFLGMNLGLVPIWVSILGSVFAIIFIGTEFTKLFGGELPQMEYTPIISSYEPEPEPEKVTVNCKNCGGPNVDRVTCEYCGLVLE